MQVSPRQGKSNLPPIRIANHQQGVVSGYSAAKPSENRSSTFNSIRMDDDNQQIRIEANAELRRGNVSLESENQELHWETFAAQNEISGRRDKAKQIMREKFRCSAVQREVISNMSDGQALSDARGKDLSRTVNQVRHKDLLTRELLQNRSDTRRLKSCTSVGENLAFSSLPRMKTEVKPSKQTFLSPSNRRRFLDHDRLQSSASSAEKGANSIPSKNEGSSLYISILGKNPICREFPNNRS